MITPPVSSQDVILLWDRMVTVNSNFTIGLKNELEMISDWILEKKCFFG